MYAQKCDSMIKKALKSVCRSNGWCYAIFWGFDITNSLLLTFKEAYYEEQMGALIDSMLLQAHVLGGGGVIGQTAFMKNHRCMYSDELQERQNYSLGSLDSLHLFQEDSDFFWQFSMGIKTISVISVEPWGVVQLGSTQKKAVTEGFVDEVKQVLREMEKWDENMKNSWSSSSSSLYFEGGGFMEANNNNSLVLPSQSFPSTSNYMIFPCENNTTNLFDYDDEIFSSNPYAPPPPLNLEELWLDDEDLFVSGNYKLENLATNSSLQSSVTHVLRCCNESTNALNFIPTNSNSSSSSSLSLFSQLGIDHLLDGIPSSCSLSKRRKIDNLSWTHNHVKFEREEAHSCVDVDTGKPSTSRGQEEQFKIKKKKKAKAGTRPRPKDRQMIQDRLSELRGLVPNGHKMSIDRLLGRTIRHLNFMQSLTKHAAALKQINTTTKNVEEVINKSGSSNGGVTWACEVGDHNMVCPLIVEDLTAPAGQMLLLIQMLCEEDGLFLEIVDIIRGFGLAIRKGVMEVCETNKLWAHFMVEAEGNRHVSRHEIFSSLIQLLQMTGQTHDSGNVMSSPMPAAFNNFEAFPINFPDDALQCGSLL